MSLVFEGHCTISKRERTMKKLICATAIIASFASSAVVRAEDIKMGALATLEGAFAALGEDGMRGVELALHEFYYPAGG